MPDSPMNPANISYLEDLFGDWNRDPASVTEEWGRYFAESGRGGTPVSQVLDTPSPALTSKGVSPENTLGAAPQAPSLKPIPAVQPDGMAWKQSRVNSLIWAYRDIGYLYAKLNPLVGYLTPSLHYLHEQREGMYERLSPEVFGLSVEDLDRKFSAGRALKPGRLRDILEDLDRTYCSSVGVEFLHIQEKPIRHWLITQMETTQNRSTLDIETRRTIMEDLIKAEEFEHFLHTQFIGQKRFSLEGSEVLIPALHFLVDAAIYRGAEEIVLGMSHRGRLNVLAHILNKPAVEIFSEFEAASFPDLYGGSGDVKYHLGYRRNHVNEDGRFVTVTLASNPSHLESIDPVVEGLARGAQILRADTGRKRVIPVLIHGDAAFSGQGVVAETFNLSQTLGYRTGGTIHIIVNNQIGFTTSTRDARSTFFPTDIAKIIPVPILHVNGDDPEAVIHVINLALNFRQEFGRDVIIDVFCYRRHGHNEGDEPSFTHPRMYRIIRQHRSVTTLYGEQLAGTGVLSSDEQTTFRESYIASLRDALKGGGGRTHIQDDGLTAAIRKQNEQNLFSFDPVDTGVSLETLKGIGGRITEIPSGFHIHSKLKRIVETRTKNIAEGGPLDFSTAESLAFGSLLLEKTAIRLSGEDSGRGTFSQRHAVWWDIETAQPTPFVPLNSLSEDQATFAVFDSPLSEYSILGFEYGYSLAVPEELVLWEAQFGDFANGAQVLIDNYLASGEAKWNSRSRLVMLLPHGYEGMGPEHSSAHLERYLMLCAEDNLQVCNVTTPSQYFHLLRRQMKQTTVKPLILMTPKSLLRHPAAVSYLEELATGHFQCVLDDAEAAENPREVERLCLCSGKIYFDLAARRTELENSSSALIRIEQLYPFPAELLEEKLQAYTNAHTLIWVQEETRNRGAWNFVKDRMAEQMGIREIVYIGREPGASPATGSHRRHQQELESILSRTFEKKLETAARSRGEKSTSVSGKR